MNRARKLSAYSAAALVIGSCVCIVCGAASVVTHHMDNFRTGWNPGETTLTTANVNKAHFSQQAVALVGGQIDGQPLVLSNQNVNGTVYPTVVYVATENNSVYAVNGSTGAVLASVNLGASVAAPTIPPGTCHSNAPVIGISSTPVIDTSAGTLYVVTTISASGTIAHYLHALSTSTLADKMSLAIQSPAGITYSRQRSALTLFNGGVLIPFSSFCDNNRATTRGYLVYANLSVSPASQTDFQTSYYDLSSIWMSGSGPAVVGNNIYFSTGNGGTPYPPANRNLPESLVKLTGSTAGPLSLGFSSAYTPGNYSYLDSNDLDFGSGGVLIVPSGAPTSIKASTPAQFVTAAGKVGILFVNNLALSNVQQVQIGDCWCGTTYFTGADGKGHVVTGGGTTLGSYNVSANGLSLTSTASLPSKTYGDAGVFTTVSSNGLTAGSGIVWAVSGPDSNYTLHLYAYDAANMSELYSSQAGWWSNVGGNSNTVPVAANGHVYVASNGELTIWGPAPGPLPAAPTGVGTDGSTDCPLMKVSWNPAAGATSYQLYFQPFGQAIVGSRRLKYTGSATSVAVTGGGNQLELVTVTACNQNGCSDPSVPAYGEVHKPCF